MTWRNQAIQPENEIPNFHRMTRQSTVLSQVTEKLRERLNIRNERIFRKANDILIKIIFESKTKPWWIYVNALSNYVDWLYTHSIDVAMISLMMAAEMDTVKKSLPTWGSVH